MTKLKLGYGVSLPIAYNAEIPEYSLDNIKLIKSLSNKFHCIQIMFSKKKISSKEINDIKTIIKNYKLVFIHASYQINIGADLIPSQSDLYNTGIDILLNEIDYGCKLGAKGIVIHMGKNVRKQYDDVHIYNNMVKFIIELFKKLKIKKIKLPVLLETPAGQGGEMCWELKEFIEFIVKFSKLYFYPQLQICIDTCHIFQAGYDLNNSKIINQIHQLLEPIKNKICLIHINDSYHQVGEHIDRHAQIGEGYIQINKLIKFIHPYKKIPMILETVSFPVPYKNFSLTKNFMREPYEKQIKLLS